jgi:dUTP pyrophosphatase
MTNSSQSHVTVRFKRMPGNTPDMGEHALPLPRYETPGSAGFDLRASIPVDSELVIAPGELQAIPTGFMIVVPLGFEAQIRPRSGLAFKHKITVLNTPGTVDSDFRNECLVLLFNAGKEPFRVTRGMRIAQMIVAPVTQVAMVETDEVEDTTRGAGGFGSTGLR